MKKNKTVDWKSETKLRNGQVIIPKKLFEAGIVHKDSEVTVSVRESGNEIVIKEYKNPSTENRVVLNQRGAIWIPVEIKRFWGMEEGDSFELTADDHNREIVLCRVEMKGRSIGEQKTKTSP